MGDILATPRSDGPLLPGIMRGVVLGRARSLGIETIEGEFSAGSLDVADEAFLTNSLRGIVPVARLFSRDVPAPGALTRRLRADLLGHLANESSGGMDGRHPFDPAGPSPG